ncbi:uncharacterized protein EV420DRAFT_1771550 [Desarmillaria tabescens]|uniref:MYND-type domain-containing protein n=1 Tax=Armillaria tabescens TaxID=1929756 RepID=A0AA39IZJ2_ARMTA|nr:uncharacterized protein EV420DRAFT_1771550 [Desarmillaria tabescens]KAK0433387.1 hypothetical protein EV420DRAFT_1771550 [Desarmillaria tabescens]
MTTNPDIPARAWLTDEAIERRKQAMYGSVSVLDEVPDDQILPAYIDVFQHHLSPSKIPSRNENSLNVPSTIMAIACFRTICRGLHSGYQPGWTQGFSEMHSEFSILWPGIRAWSLHFISVCTSKNPSVSGLTSGSGVDLTTVRTVTAMCLESLARRTSYYELISTDDALHPYLVEFWRQSCLSRCHVTRRHMSCLLYNLLFMDETRWVGWSTLEVNPVETAKLCFDSVLEDYVEGDGYDDDAFRGSCPMDLMTVICKSPILSEAVIHEKSVQFICSLMRRFAGKIIHLRPTRNSGLWNWFRSTVNFLRASLSHSNLPIILALVDSRVLVLLLRVWPLLPYDRRFSVRHAIPSIMDAIMLYTSYRSVAHGVIRSIISLDKKGVIVDIKEYTAEIVRAWSDLKSIARKYYVIRRNCDKLRNVCFACRRVYGRNMQCCSKCESVQYCSMLCQRTHWKTEHKAKCIKSKVTLKDRKYLAFLAQVTIIKHDRTLLPFISDYMNEFSVTERSSLAIEVSFRKNPKVPKLSIKRITDIADEVGEIKPWLADNHQGERDTCGMVRVLAPGGFDQSHIFPSGWTAAKLTV